MQAPSPLLLRRPGGRLSCARGGRSYLSRMRAKLGLIKLNPLYPIVPFAPILAIAGSVNGTIG